MTIVVLYRYRNQHPRRCLLGSLGGLFMAGQDHSLNAVEEAVKVTNALSITAVCHKHNGTEEVFVALFGLVHISHGQLDVSQVVGNGHGFHDTIVVGILHHGVRQLVEREGFLKELLLLDIGTGFHGGQMIAERQVEENGGRELNEGLEIFWGLWRNIGGKRDNDGALEDKGLIFWLTDLHHCSVFVFVFFFFIVVVRKLKGQFLDRIATAMFAIIHGVLLLGKNSLNSGQGT